MKKGLLLIISLFIFSLSFNAKAYAFKDYDYYGNFDLKVLIHKTDEAGKGLEGATFTAKDFSGTSSLDSYDKSDGDYLIESHLYSSGAGSTSPAYVEDGQPYANLFDKLYKMMPKEYQDIFDSVSSYNDLNTICNNNSFLYCGIDQYYSYISFVVPAIIDETKAPSGYESGKWVIPAFYDMYIYNSNNSMEAYFNVNVGYNVGFYFEYDENVDYVKLFNELYSSDAESYNEFLDLVEDAGGIIVEDCYYSAVIVQMDVENRFSNDELDGNCVIQLTDTKIKEKDKIIVNPETAGTIVVIGVLLLGIIGFFTTRKMGIEK